MESVLSALPKDQQTLGQRMVLPNTKVDNYATQMMDRQRESEHYMKKMEGRQHESDVQRCHALEKQNNDLRDTIGRVQVAVKTHQDSPGEHEQVAGGFQQEQGGHRPPRRPDARHAATHQEGFGSSVQNLTAEAAGTPAEVEERPGIVFGGFAGCVLAEKSSQWLCGVLERYQIEVLELASRTRRPKALVLRFATRGDMWKVSHWLKIIAQDLRDPSHEMHRPDIPAPWITLDQSVEERERTRPIAQATRCCRSAAESLGLNANPQFDIEARYQASEEIVTCTFDGWRSEILIFYRDGNKFVFREQCNAQIQQDLYEAIAKEWELSRAGSSRSSRHALVFFQEVGSWEKRTEEDADARLCGGWMSSKPSGTSEDSSPR